MMNITNLLRSTFTVLFLVFSSQFATAAMVTDGHSVAAEAVAATDVDAMTTMQWPGSSKRTKSRTTLRRPPVKTKTRPTYRRPTTRTRTTPTSRRRTTVKPRTTYTPRKTTRTRITPTPRSRTIYKPRTTKRATRPTISTTTRRSTLPGLWPTSKNRSTTRSGIRRSPSWRSKSTRSSSSRRTSTRQTYKPSNTKSSTIRRTVSPRSTSNNATQNPVYGVTKKVGTASSAGVRVWSRWRKCQGYPQLSYRVKLWSKKPSSDGKSKWWVQLRNDGKTTFYAGASIRPTGGPKSSDVSRLTMKPSQERGIYFFTKSARSIEVWVKRSKY